DRHARGETLGGELVAQAGGEGGHPGGVDDGRGVDPGEDLLARVGALAERRHDGRPLPGEAGDRVERGGGRHAGGVLRGEGRWGEGGGGEDARRSTKAARVGAE